MPNNFIENDVPQHKTLGFEKFIVVTAGNDVKDAINAELPSKVVPNGKQCKIKIVLMAVLETL